MRQFITIPFEENRSASHHLNLKSKLLFDLSPETEMPIKHANNLHFKHVYLTTTWFLHLPYRNSKKKRKTISEQKQSISISIGKQIIVKLVAV